MNAAWTNLPQVLNLREVVSACPTREHTEAHRKDQMLGFFSVFPCFSVFN